MAGLERTRPDRKTKFVFQSPLIAKVHCLSSYRRPYFAEHIMALPNDILARILECLYTDFLGSDECIDIGKHHCSLLHPCISISNSTSFKPIYTFRLISSNWNMVFLSTAKLDRHSSHRIVQGPRRPSTTYIYSLLRKSVVLRRYRIFRNLDTEHGIFLRL